MRGAADPSAESSIFSTPRQTAGSVIRGDLRRAHHFLVPDGSMPHLGATSLPTRPSARSTPTPEHWDDGSPGLSKRPRPANLEGSRRRSTVARLPAATHRTNALEPNSPGRLDVGWRRIGLAPGKRVKAFKDVGAIVDNT
jgi:hypothetical protein